MKNKKGGFTMVELIVVITILVILSAIGFVSFSGYLGGVRDANRTSQLNVMNNGLELYGLENNLPIPDGRVDVNVSGTLIAYQGDIGKNVLNTIGYKKDGLDPKYKEYFSYYLTKDKKDFQLMAFLEETNSNVVNGVSAADYSDSYPKTLGEKLGILTDENNNPIQKLQTITDSGFLDIINTDKEYKMIFSEESFISGTGKTLKGGVAGGGLVGYWSFDEIVDNSFVDYSENGAVGTLSGGVSLGTGQSGNSAVFNGTDGEFVVDKINKLGGSGSSPHTVSAWIKPYDLSICSDGSGDCREWILSLFEFSNADFTSDDTISNTVKGTHHWTIRGTEPNLRVAISHYTNRFIDNTIENEWQNITSVFDGNTLTVYYNGKKAEQYELSQKNYEFTNITEATLYLGKKLRVTEHSNYNGEIDELRIFNKALTQKEVELLYKIDK